MPAKKEDYEKIFNKIFGTNIKWSKLSLEELMELAVLFNHPEVLYEKLGVEAKQEMGRKRLVEVGVDVLTEAVEKSKWDGPLIQLAKKVLGVEKKPTGQE